MKLSPQPRVILAAVAGAHGIGGEVRLKLFAESIDSLTRYERFEADGRTLTLTAIRRTGKQPVARFAEIEDRNAAEALRGTELSVPRSALPELTPGEYYHADVIGRECVSDDGAPIGTVVAVENFGAGDILEIAPAQGKAFMIPIGAATIGDLIVVAADFLP